MLAKTELVFVLNVSLKLKQIWRIVMHFSRFRLPQQMARFQHVQLK